MSDKKIQSELRPPEFRAYADDQETDKAARFGGQQKRVTAMFERIRRETRKKDLEIFTVWLLKTHNLLIDKELLAQFQPEADPPDKEE